MAGNPHRFTTISRKLVREGELAWGGVSGWSGEIDQNEGVTIQNGAVVPSGIPGPTEDLILYYPFTDGTATDEVGSYDGSVTGATHVSDGGPQGVGAFSFNGDDYIQMGASPGGFSSGFAVAYWVKPDSFQSAGSWTYHISYDSGDDPSSVFRMEQDDDAQGELDFGIRDTNAGSWVEISSGAMESGSWQLIVGQMDEVGNITLYRDASVIGTATIDPTGVHDAANTLWLAARLDPKDYWRGDLTGVRLYSSALTDTQVQELYDATR